MPFSQPLDCVPLWALPFATLGVVLLAMEIGFRLGRRRARAAEHEKESLVGAAVAATLALVGFMLAFAFGVAGSRFDTRRQAVLDEANAIGTTYLRASLLPDGSGKAIRETLREYTDSRLEIVRTGDVVKGIQRANELHGRLWTQAEPIARQHPESIQVGLFIQSLNQLIDLHTTRVVASLYSRIPLLVWISLYTITVVAMLGIGYHAGLESKSRSLAFLLLAVTFSAVIFLVADLDRPREGLLRVGHQAIVDVRNTME